MKARYQRLLWILGGVSVLGVMTFFVLSALSGNLMYFYSPADIAAGKAPQNRMFRVGGLVRSGSLAREADGVTIRFVITDTQADITVLYKGPLPDLFAEGKGAVAQGKLMEDGVFAAHEVLAKHDENYMPPEAAAALEQAHREGVGGVGNPAASTIDPAISADPQPSGPLPYSP
jgi:cytochrome c-type biogenesis protein CcmE